MKLSLLSTSLVGLLLISCASVNSVTQQLQSPLSVKDDPLGSPLKNVKKTAADSNSNLGVVFPAGSLVETALPNAEFFNKYPLFGRKPSSTLGVSTSAKVLSQRGSYTKVELSSGDVGYIPSVSLIEKIDYEPSYVAPEDSAPIPITPPSDPPPPTEDEILRKINERQEANRAPEPASAPSKSNLAPVPEVLGINPPSGVTPSQPATPAPPAVPQVPSVPQVPQAPPVTAPEVVAPPLPAPDIKIARPTGPGTAIPIDAPPGTGGALNQDSSLELRITEPTWR